MTCLLEMKSASVVAKPLKPTYCDSQNPIDLSHCLVGQHKTGSSTRVVSKILIGDYAKDGGPDVV